MNNWIVQHLFVRKFDNVKFLPMKIIVLAQNIHKLQYFLYFSIVTYQMLEFSSEISSI